MTGPSATWLPDGRRLHLQHGPIDLIIEASGAPDSVDLAYRAAWERFQTVLAELVDELPRLRTHCPPEGLGLKGAVARRMEEAVRPYASHKITPMAAVAGAVADEILAAMTAEPGLNRAYVNNGGDIALHVSEGAHFRAAMVGQPARPVRLGTVSIGPNGPKGIATSGRHGRSLSLGIADSVTALADTAAAADAAATLIANAVDLPRNPGVRRVAARHLDPDSDLGDRLVTVDVQPLTLEDAAQALEAGAACARALFAGKTLVAAALALDGQMLTVGDWPDRTVETVCSKRTDMPCLDSPEAADYKNIAPAQRRAMPR